MHLGLHHLFASEPPAPAAGLGLSTGTVWSPARSQPVPREDWPAALPAEDVVMPRPSGPHGEAVP